MDRKSDLQSAVMAALPGVAKGTPVSAADEWFEQKVLPLEALLMQYLERNWRNPSDVPDFRQDVYVRVYEAALKEIPQASKPFLFTTARNLLISRMRREQVVPIEAVSDVVPIETASNLEELEAAADTPSPERTAVARDELRHLQAALDRLPPRCREAIILRRVNGLSRGEIALRMGISELSVSSYLSRAICVLADTLHGEPSNIRRRP